MRFTPFAGPENPVKHGENAKVAKSTRVCPPTTPPFLSCANPQAHNQKLSRANRYENDKWIYKGMCDLNCSVSFS